VGPVKAYFGAAEDHQPAGVAAGPGGGGLVGGRGTGCRGAVTEAKGRVAGYCVAGTAGAAAGCVRFGHHSVLFRAGKTKTNC